jgi:phosphoglycolate phosphatase
MHQSLPIIRAFAFDYDDTLVQTRACRFAAIKAVAQRFYAHTFTDTEIEYVWGRPFQTFFCELFSALDSDPKRVIEHYLSLRTEFPVTAYPGAVEAIRSLSTTHPVSIVTSASQSVVLEDVEALGFPIDQILTIQCAEATTHHKPDPRVFEPLQQKLAARGIQPHEIMYVGDAASDYIAARDAGFTFAGFTPDNLKSSPFAAFSVPTVSDLRQLVTLCSGRHNP